MTAVVQGADLLDPPLPEMPVDDLPAPTPVPEPAAASGGVVQSLPRGRMWVGFATVLAAMIMNLLDGTIVNVAAPAIQRDLHTSATGLEWVAAAYTLAVAVGLLTGGRLGDIFGRRRIFLIGVAGFVLASVGCAVAWSSEALIISRVLQGLSAALLTPQSFGLIRDLFPPARMGSAFAALGPTIGLATIAGPVVAGTLMKADLFGTQWRALFLINVPLGVFAVLTGRAVLPIRSSGRAGIRLDLVGTLLMAAVSVLLVFPLVDGRERGWPAWIFLLFGGAAPVLGLFALHQRRRLRSGRSVLVELSVLRKRSYASGVVFTLVFFGTIVGFMLTMGLFLQLGLGMTAMTAALYLCAITAGAFVGSGVGAWAATAVGRPILHIGLVIMAGGAGVLLLALHAARDHAGSAQLIPGLAVFGLGMGMIFVPLFSIIMCEIDDHEVGSASGLLEALQQLGATLGIAVLATLYFGRAGQYASGGGRMATLSAVERTLVVTLGLVCVASVVGWLLPRRARQMH